MTDTKSTPRTLTGGCKHKGKLPLIACVDWFSATFFDVETWEETTKILNLDFNDFDEQEKGFNGYKRTVKKENILIAFDGSEGMGIHVNMSGQACRQYESTFTNGWDWQQLFFEMRFYKFKVSRLDLALDDYEKRLNLNTLYRKAKNGEVVTRFNMVSNYESWDIHNEDSRGQTIYYGSPKSEIKFRFYDKKRERERKNFLVREDIKSWQRYEIELKNDRATKAVIALSSSNYDLGEFIKGIFKNYLNFITDKVYIDNNNYKNKTCRWWTDFLGSIEKIKLTKKREEPTIERTKAWIEHQVATGLTTLAYSFNEKLLYDYLIQLGHDNLTKNHKQNIVDFSKKKELKDIFENEMFEYLYNKKRAINQND
jgi:phage replication initiation protein